MRFELIQLAQDRWRAVDVRRLVAPVRAGATFINGRLAGRPTKAPSRKPPEDLPPQVLTIALCVLS
jgi:hypothetical protein